MKTPLFTSLFCLSLIGASLCSAQNTSFSYNDSTNGGTLVDSNPALNAASFTSGTGTFTFDIQITTVGSTTGYSLWLQTEMASAPRISITNESYFIFTTGQSLELPKTFSDPSGANPGFLSDKGANEAGDLGAIGSAQPALSGAKVATLTFSLNGLAPGTYSLRTTILNPKPSEATVNFNDDFATTSAIYTITIVPEPSTWMLLIGGGLVLASFAIRRTRDV